MLWNFEGVGKFVEQSMALVDFVWVRSALDSRCCIKCGTEWSIAVERAGLFGSAILYDPLYYIKVWGERWNIVVEKCGAFR